MINPKLETYLKQVPGPQGAALRRLYDAESAAISTAPGSRASHHAFTGGYTQHLIEMLRLATKMLLNIEHERDFTYTDVIVAVCIHDLEKPWLYDPDRRFERTLSKSERMAFRREACQRFGLELTAMQWNAVDYAEGEFDYVPGEVKMTPLAAFVHALDILSARWIGVTKAS